MDRLIPLLASLLFISGTYPLARAWQANRSTSLSHALAWALAAWAAWGLALLGRPAFDPATVLQLRYLALVLTGCFGVAVLGARRPGVAAWNFVVLGLLAVLLLPVAEGWLLRQGLHLTPPYLCCLAATVALGLLNYLPTRLGLAAVLVGVGCAAELATLTLVETFLGQTGRSVQSAAWCLGSAAWLGWWSLRRPEVGRSEFDRTWLVFRDRFGFVWGQRLREQFNHAAAHAGWPVVLRWGGLRLAPGQVLPPPEVQAAMLTTLRALMKRFGAPEVASFQ